MRGREAAAVAGRAASSSSDLRRCMSGQAVLLLLPGFLGATFSTYRRELRERRAFLAARMAASPGPQVEAEARRATAMSCLDFACFGLPAVAAMYIYGVP